MLRNAHGRDVLGSVQCVVVDVQGVDLPVPKIMEQMHARGREGLVSPRVALVALGVAAVAVVLWLCSRKRRRGGGDVADLFEAVEVGGARGNAPIYLHDAHPVNTLLKLGRS